MNTKLHAEKSRLHTERWNLIFFFVRLINIIKCCISKMIFTSLCQTIIVRYARKPIWMPTAPSKLFRIPEHTFYSRDEVVQIVKLNDAYKAQLSSIGELMRHEFFIPAEQSGGLPNDFIEREKIEDEKVFRENERKNMEIAKQREEFMSQQLKSLEDKVIEEKLRREDHLMLRATEIDEYIKTQKSDPMSVVTPDNIEIAIDHAMDNPLDLEFCIDRRGRRIGPQAIKK